MTTLAQYRQRNDPWERLWANTDRESGCWLWLLGDNGHGYARISVNGRQVLGHRWVFEQLYGPVPEGMQLDHLCRVRRCVNPIHLEVVTARENTLRGVGIPAMNAAKTYCKHGHPLDGVEPRRGQGRRPSRYCLTCNRQKATRVREARRANAFSN